MLKSRAPSSPCNARLIAQEVRLRTAAIRLLTGAAALLLAGCSEYADESTEYFGDEDVATITHELSAWPTEPSQAFQFDGTNDWIAAPDATGLDVGSGSFTVGAWVKPPADLAPGQFYVVLAKNAGTIVGGVHLPGFQLAVVRNANEAYPHFQLLVDNGSSDVRAMSPLLMDYDWHHVAATRTGNSFSLFVDGTPVANASLSGSLANNRPLLVGAWASPAALGFARGHIDEVFLYKRALSASEVRSFSDRGPAGPDSTLHLYYPFDNASAQDRSGYARHGTVNGSPAISAGRAMADAALSLNGSSAVHFGSETETNFGTQDFTISCFVRLDTEPSAEQTLVGRGLADATRPGYRLSVGPDTFHFDIKSTGGVYRLSAPAGALKLGRFHHVVAVRLAGVLRLYVDGLKVADHGAGPLPLNLSTTAPFAVGASFYNTTSAPTRHLSGSLDNVTAMNRALSDVEVATYRYTGVSAGTPNVVKLLAFRKGSTQDISSFQRPGTSVGTPQFRSGATLNRPEIDALSDGYRVPRAVRFNGQTHLTIGNSDFRFTAQNFTIAASVKLEQEPGANQTQVLVGSGTAGVTYAFRLALLGRKPAFQIATTGGGLVAQTVSATEIPLGQWGRVAAVRSGSVVKLYLNGIERGQVTMPGGSIPAAPFVVGGNNITPRNPLTGLLHNVGVYSSALAQSRVAAIGDMGMEATDPSLILHLPLRDKTLTDLGPKRRSVQANGPVTLAPGENLRTRTMDWNGTNTYVSVDSPAFNFQSSHFTMSGFFRTTSPAATLQTLISKGFASGGNGYRLSLSAGVLTFSAKTGNATLTVAASNAPVTDTNWHHFGVVRAPNGPNKKDSLNLYLDGKFQGRADVPSGLAFSGSGRLVLGATLGAGATGHFSGELDSVAFLNRGLLGRELRMQSQFGPDPQDPSLLAHYTFDDLPVLDVSRAERHPMLSGSTTTRPGIRFAGHDFMLELERRSGGKGFSPVPGGSTVTLDRTASFTYDDLPAPIALDSTPPVPMPHGAYPTGYDDGIPDGTEPYRISRTDNFDFDYFTPGLSYGWTNTGPINEYAALHGFSAVGIYNDVNGQRTVPASTRFTVNLGIHHANYLAAQNAENWDDLAQTPESSLTSTWNATVPPSTYAPYDWVIANIEGNLPRGPGPEDDFYADRPNPSRGAPEREGFRRSYRSLATAIQGSGKLIGNYGWSPAGPRDFWSSPHIYPDNIFPSDHADWETHNASITEKVDLVTPSAYVSHPGWSQYIVMMNAVQARNLLNLRADLEEKKILPYLWNLFHGNSDPRLWQAWNPLTTEEMGATVFDLLFTGVDGFILWDGEGSNPVIPSPAVGRFRRSNQAFLTGAPVAPGTSGSACGRPYPHPTSARQVKAYDPIYVVSISGNFIDYQVGARDPSGYSYGSCTPESTCPGCDQMSPEERAEFLNRRFMVETAQVDRLPMPTQPTFPIYRMTKTEFEQRVMVRAANFKGIFESLALARWIERPLYFGLPLDNLKASVDASDQANKQRGVGFVSIAKSQYGPYLFATPFDAAWENASVPLANIVIRNFANSGSNVSVQADKETRFYILYPEP